MKIRVLFICFIICCSTILYSQNMNTLDFINGLDNKQQAVFGDAVKLMVLDMGKQTTSFSRDLAILNEQNNIAAGYTLDERALLRKGTLARLIARYLDLSGSFMYNIFGTERYAYRACVAAGIMTSNGSEWDIVSGEELLEIMRRTAEVSGVN